jgi:SNF2 family DNA or RNA helicase
VEVCKIKHWEQIDHCYAPRDNQKIAIDNVVDAFMSNGFYGLLLEMSLGKSKVSLNAAEIMKKYKALDRLIIICPKAIQSVWLEEIPKHTHLNVTPVIWENKPTLKQKRAIAGLFKSEFPILILRLEMFQRKNETLKEFLQKFFQRATMVILDESSKIKNVTTQRTPRLIEYTKDSAYRTILTGTPWTESPLDIFSQMEFLHTGFWYKYNGDWSIRVLKKHWYLFKNRYAIMKEIRVAEGRTFKTVVGTRRTEEIAKKIQSHVTQQKKKDWQDLPDKIFQTLHVEMGKEQAEAYNTLKETLILEHGEELLTVQSAVTLLTRLRQLAGGFYPETGEPIASKLAGIEMLMEDVAEYPGKVIISCAFVAEVEGIIKALKKEYGDDKVLSFYGATKNRDEVKAKFKNEDVKFLVGTEKVMAYGHNWQFCSLMYRYSLAFSYERNKQLTDRIHRPGMVGEAVYKDILHDGTVQEKTVKSWGKKQDVVAKFDEMTLKDFLGGE